MRAGLRSRAVLFSLSLALGAMALPACKNKKELLEARASATQSLEELKGQIEILQKAMSDVRKRFDALPEDLPVAQDVREMAFSIEEVLGVEGARIRWLSGELNAAVSAGSKEQVLKVSEAIRGAMDGNKATDKAIMKLTHQLLPYESMANLAKASQAAQAARK